MHHALGHWRRLRHALPVLRRAAVIGLTLLGGAALAQSQGRPANLSQQHEQQLQAIRQALLDATLEAPTKVVSTAWIDSQGALRESHEFRTGAEVRGVRVTSYLQDGEEPRARVSADVLPWGWRPRKGPQTGCESPPRTWRQTMAITSRIDRGFASSQHSAASVVLSAAMQHWGEQLQGSGRWTPVAWQAPPSGTYMKALLRQPTEDSHDWLATLSLRPIDDTPQTLPPLPYGWSAPPPWRWILSLQITQRQAGNGDFQEVAREQLLLELDPRTLSQHPHRKLQTLTDRVMDSMADWVQRLEERTRCESAQFVVRREPDASLKLHVGSASGLRVGDRVLLMQPGWVPSRLLDARSLEHLALAEVVETGPRMTEIRLLAGPPLPPQGQWLALPL